MTKEQRAAYQREWNRKNPDKVKAKRAAYRAKLTPEQVERERAAKRAWAARNREKTRAYQRAWAAANPDKVQAKKARYLESRTQAQKERDRETARAWRLAHPDPKRGGAYCHDRHVVLTFGLKPGEYAALLAAQGGGCKICGGHSPDGRRLHVDHCHKSGAVRGLLCKDCNVGLGSFKDSHELLAAAARYLEEAGG